MRILSCNAPYGSGGVGQHFAQLVEETRRDNLLQLYYARPPLAGDPPGRVAPMPSWQSALLTYTPLRYFPGWQSHLDNDLFDRYLASELSDRSDRFMGFVGKSLHSFRQARSLGTGCCELVAANSHVDNVRALHDRASRDTGISDTWLNEAQRTKTRAEYEEADLIYVHSEYTRQSFLEAGTPEAKLRRTVLTVDPRFQPPSERRDDGVFRVVYVGRVEATKGIPLLIEAFQQLPMRNAELTIVGGWGTRVMRRYVERVLEQDPRIHISPGDPLPALQQSDVFVHPSYEDGFGYAPMEALACGVPVVVTQDTGMKEYVEEGTSGFIIPTGSVAAIVDALLAIADRPLVSSHSFLSSQSPAAHV